jgi:hypothetical protein
MRLLISGHGAAPIVFTEQQTEQIAELCLNFFEV